MIQQSHIVGGVYTHPENCAHSVLILQIFVDCPITSGTLVNLTFPGTPFATNLVGTIATIPEPASLAVFCVGLAGIGVVRRGKREALSATRALGETRQTNGSQTRAVSFSARPDAR
jgi:hypothetical protein